MFKAEMGKVSYRDSGREWRKAVLKIVLEHSRLVHAEFYFSCIITL